jgi:hypothetical protein
MKRSAVLSEQQLTESLDVSNMEHLLGSYNDIKKYTDYFVVIGTLVSGDDGL